jgi:hypothetical protein
MIEERSDELGLFLFVKSDTKVGIENMLKGLEFLKENSSLPRRLRILEDATHVNVNFDKNDFERIYNKLQEVSQNYISIRHAVIQDSPENTALAILLCKKLKFDNYTLGIFSSEQGATEWINNKNNIPSPNC